MHYRVVSIGGQLYQCGEGFKYLVVSTKVQHYLGGLEREQYLVVSSRGQPCPGAVGLQYRVMSTSGKHFSEAGGAVSVVCTKEH